MQARAPRLPVIRATGKPSGEAFPACIKIMHGRRIYHCLLAEFCAAAIQICRVACAMQFYADRIDPMPIGQILRLAAHGAASTREIAP